MIVFDNDVLNEFRLPEPDERVVSYLQEHSSEQWFVPSIVLYEFLSYHETQAEQRREKEAITSRFDGVAPFDESAAVEAAHLESRLAAAGTSLDTADLFIAAIARDRDGTLVTRNENDFDKQPIHELLNVDVLHR